MTDIEVIRRIEKRLDQQDEVLKEIREEQIRVAETAKAMAPALEEVVAFWKGSRILAKILGTLAALASLAVGAIVWSADRLK